jgi:hypothetical protein
MTYEAFSVANMMRWLCIQLVFVAWQWPLVARPCEQLEEPAAFMRLDCMKTEQFDRGLQLGFGWKNECVQQERTVATARVTVDGRHPVSLGIQESLVKEVRRLWGYGEL